MGLVVKKRKGTLISKRKRGRRYWLARITVGGHRHERLSRDRGVCAAWLTDMLAAHPTYGFDTNTAKSVETRRRNGRMRWPRHVIALECDPCTAHWHIRMRKDWPYPKKVLVYDHISEIPVAWVTDDNGGEGYTMKTARRRLAETPPSRGGSHTIRRKDGTKHIRAWDR